MINEKVVDAVYQAVCSFATEKEQELKEVPDGDEADKVKEDNDLITKNNEKLAKIKAKISINVVPDDQVYNDANESALVRLNNFREPTGAEIPPSARTGGSGTIEGQEEELFDPAKIPSKTPIIKLKNEAGNI